MKLLNIPDHLQVEIYSFLQCIDLVRLSSSCRTLKDLFFGENSEFGHQLCTNVLASEFLIQYYPGVTDYEDGSSARARDLCWRLAQLQRQAETEKSQNFEEKVQRFITENPQYKEQYDLKAQEFGLKKKRIHVRGQSKVGKTITSLRWKQNAAQSDVDERLQRYEPTNSFALRVKSVPMLPLYATKYGDMWYERVEIYDHSGDQETAASAINSALAASMFVRASVYSGFMFVFDLTDEQTLHQCSFWMQDLERAWSLGSRRLQLPESEKPLSLLVGNKLDLYDKSKNSTTVLNQAIAQARRQGIPLVLESAKDNVNCEFLFEFLLAAMERVPGIAWNPTETM